MNEDGEVVPVVLELPVIACRLSSRNGIRSFWDKGWKVTHSCGISLDCVNALGARWALRSPKSCSSSLNARSYAESVLLCGDVRVPKILGLQGMLWERRWGHYAILWIASKMHRESGSRVGVLHFSSVLGAEVLL